MKMTRVRRQFIFSLVLIVVVIFSGTTGYVFLEKWTVLDGRYIIWLRRTAITGITLPG